MTNLKEETYEEKANRQLAILGVKSHEDRVEDVIQLASGWSWTKKKSFNR